MQDVNKQMKMITSLIYKTYLIKETCKKLDNVQLYTSLEAVGTKAEYIRYGLNYKTFWDNLDRLLNEVPGLKITFMCTYNALSVTSFTNFLKEINKRRFELPWDVGNPQLSVSVPYLRHPTFLSIKTLDSSFRKYVEDSVNFMIDNCGGHGAPGFTPIEVNAMKRILSWFDNTSPTDELIINRTDFVKYFDEYDKRKGTNFLKTFPEYKNFYNMCKKLC